MRIVIATGGFDPIHSGHINYLNCAKQLGDLLIVGVNSDAWLERKKGKAFLPYEERVAIVSNLKSVDAVVEFDDSDGSATDSIRKVREKYPNANLVFANGGDRTKENIPEMSLVDSNLEFVFAVGGDTKQNSSSWILNNWSK
jgi:cytidyltransferase-like protein